MNCSESGVHLSLKSRLLFRMHPFTETKCRKEKLWSPKDRDEENEQREQPSSHLLHAPRRAFQETLCGADVTLVVFSPGEKVFSFAHPNVDAVIDRYLARAPPTDLSGAMQFVEAHRMAHVRDLNEQLTQINNHLDAERKGADRRAESREEGSRGPPVVGQVRRRDEHGPSEAVQGRIGGDEEAGIASC
ncbi:hypothetical protein JHK82_029210 [Glycine max]|nr:hypothetical protein JHK82_029210 [Glycine max]